MNLRGPVDVAIVGGGMAGASLALLIASKTPALSIALIEALPLDVLNDTAQPAPPSYDDRSSALSLGSCRIFQSLGLWDELLPHLVAIKQVHVSDRGHPAGTVLDASRDHLDALGYVVENRRLGTILLSRLRHHPQIRILSPARVTQVTPSSSGMQLQIDKQPTPLLTNLLVIADGVESSLREQLGIASDRKPYHQCAVIANITTTAFHQYMAYERFTDSGPMALLPLQDFNGEHRCALVWTIAEAFADTVQQMEDTTFLQQIQQRFGTRLGFLTKAGKRSIYPLALHTACEQVRSHLVLMGNAAHSMHPVAGQGFNLTLRDCEALADTLYQAQRDGEAIGSLAVLQRYLDSQQLDQGKTIGASHLLTLLFSSDDTSAAFLRNTGLFGLDFLPGIKQWFARQAMGLGDK
jgi:2-polyprenyl-6-methoxyphenol 4-hydroxylase